MVLHEDPTMRILAENHDFTCNMRKAISSGDMKLIKKMHHQHWWNNTWMVNLLDSDHISAVKYAITYCSSITLSDVHSAMQYHVKRNCTTIPKFLLKRYPEVVTNRFLWWLGQHNCVDLLKTCIELGHFRGIVYSKMLEKCLTIGAMETLNFLISKGMNMVDYSDVVMKYYANHPTTISLNFLISNGVNVRACNDIGLRVACAFGRTEDVKLFIEKECDITRPKPNLLLLASSRNHHGVVKLLLERGLNPNTVGQQSLLSMIKQNYHQTVELLVKYGAQIVPILDIGFKTACEMSCTKIVKLLVKYGADTTIPEYARYIRRLKVRSNPH